MLFKHKTADKKKQKKRRTKLRDLVSHKPEYKNKPFMWLIKLFYVIGKNYKLFIRSKISTLIFFFGPLLIMLLVSFGFNTSSLNNINIVTYSESFSPLSETLLQNLSAEDYNIKKVQSEQDCIDSVKFLGSHICIIFPPNMVMDNSASNNILIYADESRLNIANSLVEKLTRIVLKHSRTLSSGVVSQLLNALDSINKKIAEGKTSITELEDYRKNLQSETQSMVSSFNEFDFSYSALDTTDVMDEIDTIRSEHNLSSSVFNDLKSKINSLSSKYSSLGSKLDSAKDKATDIQDKAVSIKNGLVNMPSRINTIQSSFNDISSTIDGIKITNVEAIVSPLKMTVKPITLNRSYLVYILPSLLVLLVMFSSLLLSSTAVIREKQSSAYFRNFITPTNDLIFMIGQFVTNISLLFIQILIMLVVTSLFIPGIPLSIYFYSTIILLLFATIFVFAGMALGYLFNTGETVTIAALSAGILHLLFSNTVLPTEALTSYLRSMVYYNPFVQGELVLKWLLIFESVNFSKIYILAIFFGVSFVIALGCNFINKALRR